jgi:hypothetical protein
MYVEEDNYLAPDALAVLKQMIGLAKSARECGPDGSGCVLNLGLKRQEAVSDNGNSWTEASANTVRGPVCVVILYFLACKRSLHFHSCCVDNSYSFR